MSILTKIYKFIKPELTDAADITATNGNWDIIETELDKLNTNVGGKANSTHTHGKSDITDFPTSMKNPTALTVQFNGATNQTYDGSSAKTVNITPTAIGAATQEQGVKADNAMPQVKYVNGTNVDLNDYKEDGYYYFESTPANIPTGSNGWLMVMSSHTTQTKVQQMWFHSGTTSTNHKCYVRNYFSSQGWTEWVELMTSKGGVFTEYVDIAPSVPFDVKTKNGNRLRLISDTSTNKAYIHVLKADGTFVTDILAVDTDTGEVTSTPFMTKSGGYMTGAMYARTGSKEIPYNTGEVMNIGIRTKDGSKAVTTKFIVMHRKYD